MKNELTEVVRKVLSNYPETRDCDFKLVCWVCYITNPKVMDLSFSKVMWNGKYFKLPSFETIRRTRQKLQHDYPELRGKLYEKRMEKQGEYIDKFARGKI